MLRKFENMEIIDLNDDGSFGKFYGHPNGQEASKEMIVRLLNEFELNFNYVADLIQSVVIPNNINRITELQTPFQKVFQIRNWENQPCYPESNYRADYGINNNGRWIFVEIELSDIRRAVNAFFMDRVFRTAHMRLGIFLTPEHNRLENKRFYSQLTRRYDFIAPDYPLWVIGFDIDD